HRAASMRPFPAASRSRRRAKPRRRRRCRESSGKVPTASRRESGVLTIGYMALALLIGMGLATQVTMISAMGRLRGPLEATWVSLLATVAGFTLIMAVKATMGSAPLLPAPFRKPLVYGLTA